MPCYTEAVVSLVYEVALNAENQARPALLFPLYRFWVRLR